MGPHILQLHKQLSNKTKTAPDTPLYIPSQMDSKHPNHSELGSQQLTDYKTDTNCGTQSKPTETCSKSKLRFLYFSILASTWAKQQELTNLYTLLCESKDLALKTLQATSKEMWKRIEQRRHSALCIFVCAPVYLCVCVCKDILDTPTPLMLTCLRPLSLWTLLGHKCLGRSQPIRWLVQKCSQPLMHAESQSSHE